MEDKNLKTAKMYYKGWETADRELIRLHPELILTSPDGGFNSASDFLDACWQYNNIPFQNIEFVSGGDKVCVRYQMQFPGSEPRPFCEWLSFKDGLIKEIQIFYDRKQE